MKKKTLVIILLAVLVVSCFALTACDDGSHGLEYVLFREEYIVTGIGTCRDTAIVIPATYKGKPVTSITSRAFYRENFSSITIPEGVTSIGEYAFYDCPNLKSVTILSGATSIGEYAFYECTSLTTVTFAEDSQLTNIGHSASIGEYAFSNCTSLTSITIPEGVTSIRSYAFDYCKGLKSVIIPSSVTSIDLCAFSDCWSLTSVTFAEGVTSIGISAFQYCTSLTSITIPSSVTSIDDRAFYKCENLTTINVDTSNKYYKSIDGNLYSKDGKKLVQYAIGKTATSFVIPSSVTSLGDYAFADCRSLTSITIPSGVTGSIIETFIRCSGLTSITIPAGVTYISSYAFDRCTSLKSVTFEDPNGWYVKWREKNTSGKWENHQRSYSATDLADPSLNANRFVGYGLTYNWYKTTN